MRVLLQIFAQSKTHDFPIEHVKNWRDTSEVVGLQCVLIKSYESCVFAVNLDRKGTVLNC